jgi:hypothetical protein
VRHAGNGCFNSNIMKDRSNTRGGIANLHWLRAFCIGTANMSSSFVLVLVPCGELHSDVEEVLRKHVNSAEPVEEPAATRVEAIEDAEQLPLWRWFISSK